MRLTTIAPTVLLSALLLPITAQAQLFRAYVSAAGNDANPCTLQQPCRLLPAALNAVANGGEIWMLNSANFNAGTVNIGKSVSILAVPGAVGSLVAMNGGPAIAVTVDGLKVGLRNVVIAPVVNALGTDGVLLTGASTVALEGSVLFNLANGFGVNVDGPGKLRMVNTNVKRSGAGVSLRNGATASIIDSNFVNNSTGLFVYGNATSKVASASVINSYFSGNVIRVESDTPGAAARASIVRSTIERASEGLDAVTNGSGIATIWISGSTINGHGTSGLRQSGAGASIVSFGNNHVFNNGPDQGTLSSAGFQ